MGKRYIVYIEQVNQTYVEVNDWLRERMKERNEQ